MNNEIEISQLPEATTIDPVQDYLPIDNFADDETQRINRNTLLSLTSQPVGINDSQTLTNKTLTSPNVSSPILSGTVTGTYTLGGTPTFPANVVTTTGTQTLTNKTLTAPVINGGSITGSTVSVNAIAGELDPDSGSIYGVSVTNGVIPATSVNLTNNIITSYIQDGAVNPIKRSGGFAIGTIAAATLGTTGNKVITGLGFRPKLVRFTVLPSGSTAATAVSWGAMDENGNQFCTASSSTSASATYGRNSSTTACIGYVPVSTTTPTLAAAYVSMDADGFTINVTTATNLWPVAYEAYA